MLEEKVREVIINVPDIPPYALVVEDSLEPILYIVESGIYESALAY